jgi:hypothetical protein
MHGAQAGLVVGLLVVLLTGALVGLPTGLLVGTLVTGDCACMERVIHLLSLIRGLGTFGGACTLRTCCVMWVSSGVVVSSNCYNMPVSKSVLHQQYIAGPTQLERFWLCLTFLGWLCRNLPMCASLCRRV